MAKGEFGVTRKKVEDVLIASIRFRGQYEEVGKYMDQLFQHVEKYVNGPAFALYHSQDFEKGHDIEACAPVSQTVETDEIKSRVLEGGEMLSAVHHGSYGTLSGT